MSKPVFNITGVDGNIFAVTSAASKVLRMCGEGDAAKDMQSRVYKCHSYDEALQVIMEYVDMEG